MSKQINLEELDAALLSSIFITKCDLKRALNQGPDRYIFYDLITDIICGHIKAMYYVRQPDPNNIIIIVEENSISLYINHIFADRRESYNIYNNLTYAELVNILQNLFNITIETPLRLIEQQFTSEQRTHVRNEVIVFSKPDLVVIVDLVNNAFKTNDSLYWCTFNFENVNRVLKENIK